MLCSKRSFTFEDEDAAGAFVHWSRTDAIWCEIICSKNIFDGLCALRDEITDELSNHSFKLHWDDNQGKKVKRIRTSLGVDFYNRERWTDYADWLIRSGEVFIEVFPKYLNRCGLEC